MGKLSIFNGINTRTRTFTILSGWTGRSAALVAAFLTLGFSGTAHGQVAFSSYSLADTNGNSFFDATECGSLTVMVRNSGSTSLTGITATLESATAGVFITGPTSAYPNLAPGSSAAGEIPFTISTSNSFYPGAPIQFALTAVTGQGTYKIFFQSALPATSATRFDNSTAVAVPDSPRNGRAGVVESPINVTGLNGTITTVSVLMHMTHARDGDVRVELVAPDNTTILLVNRRGGNGTNFGSACSPDTQRTTFDDGAAQSIVNGSAPFLGTWRPEQPLTQLQNRAAASVQGTWRLRVSDLRKLREGLLQCWSLRIQTTPLGQVNSPCSSAPTADLRVTKTGTPAVLNNGGTLTYTVGVRNAGPVIATGVVLRDSLPPELTFNSATATQGTWTHSNGLVTFNIGTLAANAQATGTITTIAAAPAVVVNTVTARANEFDPDLATNSASSTNTILAVADLAITNVDSLDPVVRGNNVTYTLGVSNGGPDGADDVVARHDLSPNLTFLSATSTLGTVSHSGGVVTANIGELDVGVNATVTVTARAEACGTALTTATVSTSDSDSVATNNRAVQSTTINDPAPAVSVSAPSQTLAATGPVTYSVTYTGAASISLAAGQITLNRTGSATGTVSVSGTGTATRTVTVSGITGTGTLGISLASGTASACGGALAPAAGPAATFNVDNTNPIVNSMTRANVSPTSATMVNYTVVFSQSVTGVTADNFSLVASGVTATIGTVTGSGTTWNVPLTAVAGTGTVKVNLDRNLSTIRSTSNNIAVTTGFTSALAYDIDQSAPTVVSGTRAAANPTGATTLPFVFTFSEPVTGVNASVFTLSGSGVSGTVGVPVTVDGGRTWTISITSVSGNGTLGLDLTSPGAVRDGAGNAIAASYTSGQNYTVDQVAPSVLAIARADANPTSATTVRFTVSFSEAVSGVTAANFSPVLDGVSATVGTPVTSDGGMIWTVPVHSVSGNGALGLSLNQNRLTVIDAAGNPLAALFTSSELYNIDRTAPAVVSIAPGGSRPTGATSLMWIVTFTEPVTGVQAGNFSLSGSGVSGIIGTPVSFDGGYTWQVPVTSVSGNGTLRLDLSEISGVIDQATNPLAAPYSAGAIYQVDQTLPLATAINRTSSTPTFAETVEFDVIFSEPVSGVTSAAFTLAVTGGVSAIIGTPVTADEGLTWRIPVGSVTGNGTLRLDLTSLSTIIDAAGNEVASPFTTSQVYTIDQQRPSPVSIVRSDASPTSVSTVGFTVTFDEPVTGVVAGNFGLTGSGVAGQIGMPTSSDGGVTWNVPVTGISGTGTLGLDLGPGLGIIDPAGNTIQGTPLVGDVYAVDQTAPVVASILRVDANPTSATTLSFRVSFSEPVAGLTPAAFSLSGPFTGDVAEPVSGDGGVTWLVAVNNVAGNGELGLDLATVAGIADLVGNPLAAPYGSDQTYTVDQVPPAPLSITRVDRSPTSATVLRFMVTFSEPVSGVTPSNFSLSGSLTTGQIARAVTTDEVHWTVEVENVTGNGTLGLDLTDGTGITGHAGNGVTGTLAGEVYLVDQIAPSVVSIEQLDTDPTSATTVRYRVIFDEAVSGPTSDNFSLEFGGGLTGDILSVVSEAGGSEWVVKVGGLSGDGTLVLHLDVAAGIADAAGNTLAAGASGPLYTINQSAPVVLSILPADTNPTSATVVHFTVTFSSAVTGVTPAAFGLTGGGVTGTIGAVSGGGAVYTVEVSGVSGDGTLELDLTDSTGIMDAESNPLGASDDRFTPYFIDQTAPAAVSITRTDSSPTSATSVGFLVEFTEPVSGLTEDNFTLSAGGVSATIEAPVSMDGGWTWIVTVQSVIGNGTLAILLDTNLDGLRDGVGNPMVDGNVDSEVYQIDQEVPAVVSITLADVSPTSATTVRYLMTFSEAVRGLVSSNLGLDGVGVTGVIGTPVSADGGVTWLVEVTSVSGNGTLRLDLTSSGGVTGLAGNALGGPFTDGESYVIDQTAPSVASITRSDANPTSASTVGFTVTFSEPVSGVFAANFSLAATGVMGVIGTPTTIDGGLTWSVPVQTVSGTGVLKLVLNQNRVAVTDAAGNHLDAAFNTGEAYNVDQTPPQFLSLIRSGLSPTSGTVVSYLLRFNESVAGVSVSNFDLVTTGVSAVIGVPSSADGGYSWTIPVENISGTGSLRLSLNNTTGITGPIGNEAQGAPAQGPMYDVDQNSPVVVTFESLSPSPTNANTLQFRLVVSKPVTGLNATHLMTTGTLSGVVGEPATTDGGLTWVIPVSSVTGNGTLGLVLVSSEGVVDQIGFELTGLPVSAAPCIVDQEAPSVVSITRLDASPTSATGVRFAVTFSEAVTGLHSGDFAVAGELFAITDEPVSTDGITWTVMIFGISGTGSLGLEIGNGFGVRDAAGNDLTLPAPAGELYQIDQQAPEAVSFTLDGPAVTGASSATYTLVFSEAVSGLTTASFTLASVGGVSAQLGDPFSSDGGITWTVPVQNVSGSGQIDLSLTSADGVVDHVGNPLTGIPVTAPTLTVDQGAPQVLSILRGDANPTSASILSFLVQFTEPVTGLTSASFSLSGPVAGEIAEPVSADGGQTWMVTLTGVTGDGELRLDLTATDGVTDTTGNPLASIYDSGESYAVDQTAPVPVSIILLDQNPTSATTVRFLVTFSEAVTGVTPANFMVAGASATGEIALTTTTDQISWIVEVENVSGDGTLGLDLTDVALIGDYANNALVGLFTGEAYLIDQTAPSVTAIEKLDADPTSATAVRYRVVFSEAVSGVGAGNFSLEADGDLLGEILSVTSENGSAEWIVTVGALSGDGTIRLLLSEPTGIFDEVGNHLAAAGASDAYASDTYTIDQTAPYLRSVVRANPSPTRESTLGFILTFTEPVTDLIPSDLDLVTSGVTAQIDDVFSADGGLTWIVAVSGVTGTGTLGVEFTTTDGVMDMAGNALTTSVLEADEAYDIDQSSPTVLSIIRLDPNPNSAQTVSFLVEFSRPVYGVEADNFSTGGTLSGVVGIPATSDGGLTWRVSVSGIGGTGTLGLVLSDGTGIEDGLGNPLTGVPATGEGYDIDQQFPVIQSITRMDTSPTSASSVRFEVSFSKPVTGVTSGSMVLAVIGGTTATLGAVLPQGDGSVWIVAADSITGDGTLAVHVVDGTGISDEAGNELAGLPFTSGEAYLIDQTAPVAVSFTLDGPAITNASSVTYTLTFSEAVSGLTTASLTLTTSGGVSAQTGAPFSVDGGVTWTVPVQNIVGSGQIDLALTSGSGIVDHVGNLLTAVPVAAPTLTVDQGAPHVVSIVRVDANPTSASVVSFRLAFSEPVTGLTSASLSLNGPVAGQIGMPVSDDGGLTWNVTVTGVSGDGELRLDLTQTDGIVDEQGNDLSGPFTSGESYTVDQIAPDPLSITLLDQTPTSATALRFLVTFSEPVTGVTTASFSLSGALTTGDIARTTTTDRINWIIEVENASGDGDLGVDLTDTAGIVDHAGNPLSGTLTGEAYVLDQTAPITVAIERMDGNPTSATAVRFQVTFSEPVVGLTAASFVVDGDGMTGTLQAPVSQDGGGIWIVTVDSITGQGTLGIRLADATGVTDLVGNPLAGVPYDSDRYSFCPNLQAPVLLLPFDGETTASTLSQLNWSAVAGATYYDVYLDGALAGSVNTPGWQLSSTLGGGLHTWWIIAGDGCTTVTSAPRNFNILDAPTTPTPADKSFNCAPPDELRWSPAIGAQSYDVFLNNVLVATVTDTFWKPTSIPPGAHTWRVVARNPHGSAQGATWTFNFAGNTSADPNVWRTNGHVYAILVANGRVYLGGNFSAVGNAAGTSWVARNNLAALDLATGLPASWTANADAPVHALAALGNMVYAGGDFTRVNGQFRRSLAAVDASTGAVMSWDPSPNSLVRALAVSGSMVYAGGDFTQIGGAARSYVAALDTSTGTAVPGWQANASNRVHALLAHGAQLYAGGVFQAMGGQTRRGLAALSLANGSVSAWNPSPDLYVHALHISGDRFYIGGLFNSVGGVTRRNLACVDLATGALLPWNPGTNGAVHALTATSGAVYAGGVFTQIGGLSRTRLAALNTQTGAALGCDLNCDAMIRTLAVSDNSVIVGGDFTYVGPSDVRGFAFMGRVAPSTSAVENWENY